MVKTYSQKLNVWAGILDDSIVGQYTFFIEQSYS